MRHPNKPGAVPVPYHGNRDIKIGVLRSIIRQAGMTVDEFLASE
ncbi:MAG: type II toxin-antitoxin system HicA family toxin [Chloroflexota bacterium]